MSTIFLLIEWKPRNVDFACRLEDAGWDIEAWAITTYNYVCWISSIKSFVSTIFGIRKIFRENWLKLFFMMKKIIRTKKLRKRSTQGLYSEISKIILTIKYWDKGWKFKNFISFLKWIYTPLELIFVQGLKFLIYLLH